MTWANRMTDIGVCAECGVSAPLGDGVLPAHDRIGIYTGGNYGPCAGSHEPPVPGAVSVVVIEEARRTGEGA